MTTPHPTFPPFSLDDARAVVPVALTSYGDHSDQRIEILGDSSQHLVVLIHGGYWRNLFDREHIRPLGVALAEAGYAVAIPEFRRVAGEPDLTISDLSDALQSLSSYSLTLVGYSSGGHLALIVANNFPQVKQVIGLAPVTDLQESQLRALGRDAVIEWLGQDAVKRSDIDPHQLPPVNVRVRFIHGDIDERVPVDIARSYQEKMASLGKEIEFDEIKGLTHFEMMKTSGATYDALLSALNEQSCDIDEGSEA